MFIVPLTSNITPIEPMQLKPAVQTEQAEEKSDVTFLDVMQGIWDNAVETQAVKNEDMVNLMLGDTDSLEQMQYNKGTDCNRASCKRKKCGG